MKSNFREILAVATIAVMSVVVAEPTEASIVYSVAASTYLENFDGLASTGTGITWTDDSTVDGWYSLRENPAPAVPFGTYSTSTGSSTAGNLYSLGIAGTNPVGDRALGSVATAGPGGTTTIRYGVALQNTTGQTLTSFQLGYRGEQWSDRNATSQRLDFTYRLAAGLGSIATTGTEVAVAALNFTSPQNTAAGSAIDGNAVGNFVQFAPTTISGISWLNNQFLWLRWEDIDNVGTDHALGIDNVSFQAFTAVPEPGSLIFIVAAFGAAGVRRRLQSRRI